MHRSSSPTLSVVIPAYNNADTLPDAIASVRSQVGPDREIIVVDDGSTDETRQILDNLMGPDIRVIHQQNSGPGAARNTGIGAARGDWVALLDADDLWLPSKLERQFAALYRRPGARFCFAGQIIRMPDGTEIAIECAPAERSLFIDLLKGNRLATSTALVRRDCFDKVGLFDPTLKTGEDWDMWIRLASLYQEVLVFQPLEIYRKSADGNKYSLELLEQCKSRVLSRVFSDPGIAARFPELSELRRRVYAWHHAVLAKSYFRQRRYYRSGRRALASMRTHPSGARCLLPKATAPW